jgi:protein TonB
MGLAVPAGAQARPVGTAPGYPLRPFGAYGAAAGGMSQWLTSFAASSAIYVGLAFAAVTIGSATKQIVQHKSVDITFVEKVVQEPPPPAAPPPAAVPQAPAAAAPVVRSEQKIRKLEKPPPPKEMVAPKAMPTQAPREADPSEDKGVAVYGDGGKGDPAGLEGGVTQGGVVGGQVGGAIQLPEDATPPMPAAANTIPPYPQEAKAAGKTGTVVLKVVILADGSVASVQVMRGDEPFVSAAVMAVKSWKFTPARYKGQAISVYKIIQIPFKLTA